MASQQKFIELKAKFSNFERLLPKLFKQALLHVDDDVTGLILGSSKADTELRNTLWRQREDVKLLLAVASELYSDCAIELSKDHDLGDKVAFICRSRHTLGEIAEEKQEQQTKKVKAEVAAGKRKKVLFHLGFGLFMAALPWAVWLGLHLSL